MGVVPGAWYRVLQQPETHKCLWAFWRLNNYKTWPVSTAAQTTSHGPHCLHSADGSDQSAVPESHVEVKPAEAGWELTAHYWKVIEKTPSHVYLLYFI